jgi:hypothetical protein
MHWKCTPHRVLQGRRRGAEARAKGSIKGKHRLTRFPNGSLTPAQRQDESALAASLPRPATSLPPSIAARNRLRESHLRDNVLEFRTMAEGIKAWVLG